MANILELSEKAVHFIGFQSDRKQEKTARNQRKYNTKYNVQAVKLSNEIGSSKAAVETIPIFAMTANTFAAGQKVLPQRRYEQLHCKPIDVETIATTLEDNT